MKTIFIDTNFWLIPHLYKVDIFSELKKLIPEKFEIVTSEGVLKELEEIKNNSGGKDGTAAQVALELIKKKKVKILGNKGEVDDFIIGLAQDNRDLVVCTNDKELRRILKELEVKLVVMREKNRLVLM